MSKESSLFFYTGFFFELANLQKSAVLMAKHHKPHSGSLAFYPRKRAKKETPVFSSFKKKDDPAPLNFFGYKAGMVHVIGRNAHKKSHLSGQTMSVPCTVIECPPIRVFGVRAYGKEEGKPKNVLGEALAEKLDKNVFRRQKSLGRKKKKHSLDELLSMEGIAELRLLIHTNPSESGMHKKKPEVSEVFLGGDVEKQKEEAKKRLGGDIRSGEVFSEKGFVDVKAVTRGFGFQGVVKRFGIKMFRPKDKKRRVVGSISPWTPHTVMWTVARPGQHGYHSRTEYSKKIISLGTDAKKINPSTGFEHYGMVKGDYIILAGSVPGPVKRLVAMRENIRPTNEHKWELSGIESISSQKHAEAVA